jgi:L-amino acid N-acyltransferase YncA
MIRNPVASDAPQVAAIYNEGVATGSASFDRSPISVELARRWIRSGSPFVVAEIDGEAVGFARLTPYSDRCVERGIGEHAVYVAPGSRGLHFGRRLLDALAHAAAEAGYYKLTSRILDDNVASRAAHRAAGFTEVGVQRRHGQIDGQWRDCILVERLIGRAV